MKSPRTLRTAAAAALVIALTATVPAVAQARPASAAAATATVPAVAQARPASAATATAVQQSARGVLLPRPTGASPVGRETLHLVDRSRTDLWVPERPRELMVDLYYPARSAAGAPAPYADPREARLLLEDVGGGDPDAVARLSATRTHSVAGARPQRGRHPLVVLSPGFGGPRYTLTTLAEDLASRGYVVALVDHAHESLGTVFPGGRVLTCVACEKAETMEDMRRATVNRGRDISFLLDRLTGPRPVWRHAAVIDRKRIGASGHSLGGAAAASVMTQDARVLAGVNMDGRFGDPVPAGGLDGRPFMMLGTHTDVHLPGGEDASWDEAWRNLDGWKRWVSVEGTDHLTFSDAPLLFDQLGIPYDSPTQPTIRPERAVGLVRAYTAAFFDLHLRGIPQPLLDGPTAADPEVHFNAPAD
ncbi:alpha/beta hydrolase [Streptomyces somaliensis]|uniref:alpha/beta hydrolase family protein n=1 Tax=Streptomyces somaliensis TaxID=78355 RepID=UPI0020CD8D46|nr:alpha/beta hydrolase [Streptomyces somaliensis]MCP9945736.1 alpha/beta hydrolase [Streptomyces somaliensis]MCP9961091.1 alpha/beta hydrolase [Streptomyces somaliensis]MCP9973880.1 alpha/beta hydrolase [Streptomyces somaliensis]